MTLPLPPRRGYTDDTDLLTTGEVARLFHCHSRTIRRMIDAGVLPAHVTTLGGHRRFKRSVVLDVLAKRLAKRRAVSLSDPAPGATGAGSAADQPGTAAQTG